MPAVFLHDVGQTWRNVRYYDITFLVIDSDQVGIFSKQLIPFYSNNCDKYSPHNFTQYADLPISMEIAL